MIRNNRRAINLGSWAGRILSLLVGLCWLYALTRHPELDSRSFHGFLWIGWVVMILLYLLCRRLLDDPQRVKSWAHTNKLAYTIAVSRAFGPTLGFMIMSFVLLLYLGK